jgi:hypothetical protein
MTRHFTNTMPSTGSSRIMRSRYPPPPCVEEEPASLARELHGLSNLSEKPGIEGARVRGTVDQYPVIMNMNSSQPEAPPGVNNMPGMGNFSSDDSSGPATPPPRMAEPSLRPRSGSQATSRPWPPPASMSSSSSKPRERPLSRSSHNRLARPSRPDRLVHGPSHEMTTCLPVVVADRTRKYTLHSLCAR